MYNTHNQLVNGISEITCIKKELFRTKKIYSNQKLS